MTQKPSYDDEELEILQAFEADTLTAATDSQRLMQSHREAAALTFKKDQRLNIRISSRDLKSLQARALEEGIPYQTLAASLVHQYVNGRLVSVR